MKKIYLIAAVALMVMTGCKKEVNNSQMDAETEMINDTTEMASDTTVVDTASTDSSSADLPNKLSTETSTTTNNPAKGKFSLSETKWKLVELNGKAVNNTSGKDYYINLDSKSGKFSAFAGCNSIGGAYVMTAETKLMFSKVYSTKMACQNGNVESDFMKVLEKTDNYMIMDKSLHFHKGKKAIAKFEASVR